MVYQSIYLWLILINKNDLASFNLFYWDPNWLYCVIVTGLILFQSVNMCLSDSPELEPLLSLLPPPSPLYPPISRGLLHGGTLPHAATTTT